MDVRIRELHAHIVALCPADSACNVRLGASEARRSYVRVRVEGADALDVGKLAARFPDCRFHVRCLPTGSAIDVYLPTRRSAAVMLLRGCSGAAAVAALVAVAVAAWGAGENRY